MTLGTKILAGLVTAFVLYILATVLFWIVGALGLIVKLVFVGVLVYGVYKACGMLKNEFSSDES